MIGKIVNSSSSVRACDRKYVAMDEGVKMAQGASRSMKLTGSSHLRTRAGEGCGGCKSEIAFLQSLQPGLHRSVPH
jgi:hypothetical protein